MNPAGGVDNEGVSNWQSIGRPLGDGAGPEGTKWASLTECLTAQLPKCLADRLTH